MKLHRKTAAFIAAAAALSFCSSAAAAADENNVNITIDTSKNRKEISPYIYGVNSELMNKEVSCTAIRAGGNRFSAYNWETNASNAGSDWQNNSDNYFQQSLPDELDNTPGGTAINLSRKCAEKNNAYSLMTLQMAGYVAADMDGEVTQDQSAPSKRWNKAEPIKGSDFAQQPDLNDDTVYMDEFVNYLVNTLGDSQNGGINGYSLDNEPGLWQHTHSLIHPQPTECKEIVEKSVTLSKAVKDIDPDAEIFGPALFGYGAFTNFAGAPDWNEINQQNDYRWFIDYYLDEMKKAEDENGVRLLDVLDVHFYTEAKGECGERSCSHYNREGCVNARLNSTRSLWEDGYKEDSWIVDTGAEFFPILPNLQQSIDTYYPGTKLAITEYDFGGSYDICGGIAEADALGIFAENGVYLATLFAGEADYQCAAIDLYTNYDGNGSGFGDTLVDCESDNIELSTAYAAINGESEDVITLVITNKSFSEKTTANINISGDNNYKYVHLYGLNSFSPQVFDMTDSNSTVTVSGNAISYEMEPETVSLLVIAKDKAAAEAKSTAANGKNSVIKETQKTSSITGIVIGAVCAVIAAAVGVIFGLKKKKSDRQQ